MFKQLSNYAFINTKIRCGISYLLPKSFLKQICDTKDVQDIFSLLEDTVSYGDIFSDKLLVNDLKIIELQLYTKIINEYKKYIKFTSKAIKNLLTAYITGYEIMKIKDILSIWFSGGVDKYRNYIFNDKILYNINIDQVFQSKDIEDFISFFNSTPYYSPLIEGLENYNKHKSLFFIETSLEKFYYDMLIKSGDGLSSSDKKLFLNLSGTEIDIMNIMMIIRYKYYYKLPMGDFIKYLIPHGFKLHANTISKLIETDKISDIISESKLPELLEFNNLFSSDTDKLSKLSMLKSIMNQTLIKEVRKILAGFPFTVGTVMGYFILKRLEITTLISIINAKSYDMPEEKMHSLIN